MKDIHTEELSQNDGKEGRPAYIVHRNDVIDVSDSRLWKGGLHMKRHHAGRDLTADIQAAPHGTEMLERYPTIGKYQPTTATRRERPALLFKLLGRFPFLRRHPHPMTVHFPIVFMISTTVFSLLYLVTGIRGFEQTAYHCLGGGVLFSVVAILTGLYTWWLNYLSKPLIAITIKRRVSLGMLFVGIVAFIWRSVNPDILDSLTGESIAYLILILSFFPMVSIIGWFGAQLTFPVEEE